jgi:uncharacterized membrane protein YdjX (TVP38/TMEM64 family)
MSLLTCQKFRVAVVVAASLFFLGLVLQTPRLLFEADFPVITTLLSGSGLFAMLLSPVIMLTIAVLAIIPGISRRLELCEH